MEVFGNAELEAVAAQRLMRRVRFPCHRLRVQCLQGLLLSALDAHRANLGAVRSLEQRSRVGCIGLVAPHVSAHVARGQQRDLDAQPVSQRAQ